MENSNHPNIKVNVPFAPKSSEEIFLSNLEHLIHEFRRSRVAANAAYENYKANKKNDFFSPDDIARLTSITDLGKIQYDAAMDIVNQVDYFFKPENQQ